MLKTSEILVSEEHIDPKRDPGFMIYKLGYIGPVIDGARQAHMLWGNAEGQGAATVPVVSQAGHGFQANQAIRHDGTHYVLAQADNDTNAQVCGVVSQVIDAEKFRFVSGGTIPGGWIPGAEYFLSPTTPGLITTLPDPEIWEIGQVRLSLGFGTTQGLKVEIDVGDLIAELPTVRLVGIWDREFEFCFNAGFAEEFRIDRWAAFGYTIQEAVLECEGGTAVGVSIRINDVPVGGLESLTVGAMARTFATGSNQVNEGDRVTLNTTASFTGDPAVIGGKIKILRS